MDLMAPGASDGDPSEARGRGRPPRPSEARGTLRGRPRLRAIGEAAAVVAERTGARAQRWIARLSEAVLRRVQPSPPPEEREPPPSEPRAPAARAERPAEPGRARTREVDAFAIERAAVAQRIREGLRAQEAAGGLPHDDALDDADGGRSSSRAEEPLPTRTMARVLGEQGHYARAARIYRALIRADPDDASLRAELEALRSAQRTPRR
ncbi:MAG: hypothetical protein KC543_07495 [Myxococcales bacterium]|nr:hypothetical protein [Myxococcales bacterium]